MNQMLAWLASHYVRVGEYFLASVLTLAIAILGAALPVLGIAVRWPRRIAESVGWLLVAVGGALAGAKLLKSSTLRNLPWTAPIITVIAGAGFITIAWFTTTRYRRTTRQRLSPLADAGWRTLPKQTDTERAPSHIKLQTANGYAAVHEILSIVRKRQSELSIMVGASGAGKTSTLRDLATTCRSGWIEGDRRPVIPVYLDMARFAWLEDRVSLRDFVLSQIGHDAGFIRQVDDAWADTRINVTWLFLFDNADHPLMRWPSDEDSYSWISEVIDFLNSNPTRFRAILACEEVPAMPGKKVELAPLNVKLRAEFLSSRGVTPAQQDC